MDVKQVLAEARSKMDAAVEQLNRELSHVRTGRASVSILDGVKIDYYGTETPLNQVASLAAPEAGLITIQPWEPGIIPEIEKCIQKADLGLNPQNDGKLIRIPIPPLTEERRKKLAKHIGQVGEERKTAIRLVRRDANESIKKLGKEGLSQDEEKRAQGEVQKLTDEFVATVDEALAVKEKEILTV